MASLKVKVVDSEPAEAIGVAVPVQDAAEPKATVAVVKAVEPAEATGWAVLVQDVEEAKVSVAVSALVKAVEPAEAI